MTNASHDLMFYNWTFILVWMVESGVESHLVVCFRILGNETLRIPTPDFLMALLDMYQYYVRASTLLY